MGLKEFVRAGKIARQAVDRSRKWVKPGASLLDFAERVEALISEKARCAFPVNISANERAAHYTPSFDDKAVFGEDDVVKIDIGSHVDGFIGDVAYTVDLSGENGKLLEASESALEKTVSAVKAGVTTDRLGEIIEATIKSFGFKPVANLGGHVLEEYDLHAGFSILNVKTPHGYRLEEGMVVAIEPFATTGSGLVNEDKQTEIFSLEKSLPMRGADARSVLARIESDYRTLPFAERWLAKHTEPFKLRLALKELLTRGSLRPYPILKDTAGSLVSQAEVTVLVEKDSCKVLT